MWNKEKKTSTAYQSIEHRQLCGGHTDPQRMKWVHGLFVLFCNRKGNPWFLNLFIQWILVENYRTEWDRMNSNLSPYLSPKRETRGVYLGCSCFQAIKHILYICMKLIRHHHWHAPKNNFVTRHSSTTRPCSPRYIKTTLLPSFALNVGIGCKSWASLDRNIKILGGRLYYVTFW